MDIVRVALFNALRQSFDYLLPPALAELPPRPGQRVLVPLGRGRQIGIALECVAQSDVARERLRPLEAVLDAEPVFDDETLGLARWAARYYQHPLGDVLGNLLPVWLRHREQLPVLPAERWQLTDAGRAALAEGKARAGRQRELLTCFEAGPRAAAELADVGFAWRPVLRRLLAHGWLEETGGAALAPAIRPGPALNPEQQEAAALIEGELGGFRAVLLHGVTGSGKTEVYLSAIARCLAAGRQALVLVPEIALTEQLVGRFRARFGAAVGVLHSALGERERMLTWLACRRGEVAILIGTRSAVWTRMRDLGLVIVDEEHDPSYKQQDGFRYSARDVALKRAQGLGVPVVLGSATPSLETLANVARGKFLRARLRQRAGASPLPKVRCLDVRGLDLVAGLCPALIEALRECLARGEQSLLFLNRRGYSPLLICRACGTPRRCEHCDAFLVYHKGLDAARCHHCGRQWTRSAAANCCDAPEMALMGQGTERIEEAVTELFPGARVLRIDRDTVRRRAALPEMLAAINAREVDIVIGTQMLAKGLDFSAMTLVGVVDTDSRLYSLDFRAEERLAQLIVQVSGRAGRADLPGEVLIQTHQPRHPVLRQIIEEGYDAYAEDALAQRREAALPPYGAMALLRADSPRPGVALQFLADARRQLQGAAGEALDISYPLPALMEKRAGRYRALIVLRAAQRSVVGETLHAALGALGELAQRSRVRFAIDVDPQDTL